MINLSNTTENISYQGTVNVKKVDTRYNIVKDSFTIKNNGTKHLFKYLCDCLIQNYNPSNAPQFLDASTNSIDNYVSNVTNRSRLSNIEVKPTDLESNYNVVFSGIILYDQLKDKTTGLKSLALFPNKNVQDVSRPLAFINMISENAKEGIKLSASEVLIVEWELKFINAS